MNEQTQPAQELRLWAEQHEFLTEIGLFLKGTVQNSYPKKAVKLLALYEQYLETLKTQQ